MRYTFEHRTLALAGVFQAIKMVQQIARSGMVDTAIFESSISTIFSLDAESPEQVYGSVTNLRLGFETLIAQLGGSQSDTNKFNSELTKYLINIAVLERSLRKQDDIMNKIAQNISLAESQLVHFSVTHENILARLADIYTQNISPIKPRIIVNGEEHLLANSDNINKIRALLLAAIRSAVLWRQCGGSRWQMLFRRKAIIESAQQLLDKARRLH